MIIKDSSKLTTHLVAVLVASRELWKRDVSHTRRTTFNSSRLNLGPLNGSRHDAVKGDEGIKDHRSIHG